VRQRPCRLCPWGSTSTTRDILGDGRYYSGFRDRWLPGFSSLPPNNAFDHDLPELPQLAPGSRNIVKKSAVLSLRGAAGQQKAPTGAWGASLPVYDHGLSAWAWSYALKLILSLRIVCHSACRLSCWRMANFRWHGKGRVAPSFLFEGVAVCSSAFDSADAISVSQF